METEPADDGARTGAMGKEESTYLRRYCVWKVAEQPSWSHLYDIMPGSGGSSREEFSIFDIIPSTGVWDAL
jgi:hypothetical protein